MSGPTFPSKALSDLQQEAWDAEQISKQDRLASVKSKLEALGLTTEEVQDAFGI